MTSALPQIGKIAELLGGDVDDQSDFLATATRGRAMSDRRIAHTMPVELLRDKRGRRIWRESVDPRGSPVERYLASRDLPLPDELANDVLGYHGKATFTAWRNPDPETAEDALRAAQGALTNPCADAGVCR